jgi:hypothetical protein
MVFDVEQKWTGAGSDKRYLYEVYRGWKVWDGLGWMGETVERYSQSVSQSVNSLVVKRGT